MVDVRTYLDLELALTRRLIATWHAVSADAYARLDAALRDRDFDTALDIAQRLDMTEVGAANVDYIRHLLMGCAMFGAALAGSDKAQFVQNTDYRTLVERGAQSLQMALEHNGTLAVVKSALQLIALAQALPDDVAAEVHKAELATADPAEQKKRYLRDFVSFKDTGDQTAQLVSSLYSSRFATWGFLAEADTLGIEEYRLVAVLDSRTSEFCRMINGRTFRVADAVPFINTVLSVQNPDDLKTVQPWPNQSKASIADFRGYSADQFVAEGLMIPPFHPGCRTILMKLGPGGRAQKPQVDQANQVLPPQVTSEDQMDALLAKLTPAELDHWNAYIGLSPVDVLSTLTGKTGKELLDGALGAAPIKVAADGDVLFNAQAALGDGKYTLDAVLDPYSGVVYANRLEFAGASIDDAAQFTRDLYAGLLNLGLSTGAERLVVATGGAAYGWVKAGFTASPGDWMDLRQQMLDRLQTGDLQSLWGSLDPEQQNMLQQMLGSNNEQNLVLLADLPWTQDGQTLGQWLLADQHLDLELDLTDPLAVARAQAYLQ